ncbi:MAG TPA: hypothetical protein VFO39_06970 [Candidatus Sulfotelmatobacter sp.]|nr:hypothetical protein [Candidatus Sulfotelmatobacter sp.]
MQNRVMRGSAFLMTLLIPAGCSDKPTAPSTSSTPVTQELQRLYDADQNEPYPTNVPADPKEKVAFFTALWNERFKPRYDQVLQLIREDRLSSADDYYIAGMIMNHGIKPKDNLLAHALFTVAAFKNHPDTKWASAAALDNYLAGIDKPQLFGTVYGEHRQVTTDLMTDPLRRQFCVPSLSEQQRLADLRRKGKSAAFDRGKIQCP